MYIPESRDEMVALMINRYMSGDSIRTVAATVGRSYGFVQRALKESGVVMRTPTGQPSAARTVSPTPPPVWGPPANDVQPEAAIVAQPIVGTKAPKPGKPKKHAASNVDEPAKAVQKKKEKKTVKDKKAEKSADADEKPGKADKGKKAEKCCKGKKAEKCCCKDKKSDKSCKAKKSDKKGKKSDKKAKKAKK